MRLIYGRPHHLGKLHDELLAAVPSLRPVADSTPNPLIPGAKRAVFTISGGVGNGITLEVPDGTDASAILSVILAHDPTPPPPPSKPHQDLLDDVAKADISPEHRALLRRIVLRFGRGE